MSDPRNNRSSLAALLVLVLGLAACSGEPEAETASTDAPVMSAAEPSEDEAYNDAADSEGGDEGEGEEHDGEEGESHDEGGEGEEGGVYIAASEIWDATRKGARLMLSFNETMGAFKGTVQNTTTAKICAARVEIHLAGGIELGPTERKDLEPGEATEITLSADGNSFSTWTAHPEVSAC